MVSGFSAVSAAHQHEADGWPDVGQHRVVALLAYRSTTLTERARTSGEVSQVVLAVLELGGAAWPAVDRLLGHVDDARMRVRIDDVGERDAGAWKETDDPLFAWQNGVLLSLAAYFVSAASDGAAHDETAERALLRIIAGCVDYADWAGADWLPTTA